MNNNRLSSCFIPYIEKIPHAINFLSLITYFLIMLLVIVGIATRLLGIMFGGIINLSESLLVIGIYLGIAHTQQVKQHVFVNFFLIRLPKKFRQILIFVNLLIPLFVSTILLFISWNYALESWHLREKMDGAPFYPIYPPKIAIAVGISLLCLQLIVDLLREILFYIGKYKSVNS